MSDLNILHAQNADLKSRVSDSGLVCDSLASAPDRKDIEAFRLAMREGSQGFRDFPASAHHSQDAPPCLLSMPEEKGKDFSQPLGYHAAYSNESAPAHRGSEAFRPVMREGGQPLYDSPAATHLSQDGKPCQLNMREEGKGLIDTFQHATRESTQSADAFPVRKQEGKSCFDSPDRHTDANLELEQSNLDTNPQAQLSSLFSMAITFNDVEGPATVAAPLAMLSEEDLNMLVERILVSAADNGTQEVRLILNERVLAGTEIILSRDISGQLSVTLHCTDVNTFQTLVASQFDLKQMLESRETSSVQVAVDIHQDGNDAERRSQGYFDYEPDQLRKRDNA